MPLVALLAHDVHWAIDGPGTLGAGLSPLTALARRDDLDAVAWRECPSRAVLGRNELAIESRGHALVSVTKLAQQRREVPRISI